MRKIVLFLGAVMLFAFAATVMATTEYESCVDFCKQIPVASRRKSCIERCDRPDLYPHNPYVPVFPFNDDDDEVVTKKSHSRRIGRWLRKNKCQLCRVGCTTLKGSKREVCEKACESFACKNRSIEESEIQSESSFRIRSRRLRRLGRIARRAYTYYRGARAIGLLEDDAQQKPKRKFLGGRRKGKKFGRKGKKFPKCALCFKFCSHVKDEEKQSKCKAACKKLCSKRRKSNKKSKKVEETLSAKPAWKCPACRLACEAIKNEKKRALCLAACDATVCK